MKIPETPITPQYEISENPEGSLILRIRGNMDATNAGTLIKSLSTHLREYAISSLTVDLEDVDYLDDFGTLVLSELRKMVAHGKTAFHIINASAKINELLSLLEFEGQDPENAIPGGVRAARRGNDSAHFRAEICHIIYRIHCPVVHSCLFEAQIPSKK